MAWETIAQIYRAAGTAYGTTYWDIDTDTTELNDDFTKYVTVQFNGQTLYVTKSAVYDFESYGGAIILVVKDTTNSGYIRERLIHSQSMYNYTILLTPNYTENGLKVYIKSLSPDHLPNVQIPVTSNTGGSSMTTNISIFSERITRVYTYQDYMALMELPKVTSNGGGATHIAKVTGQLKDLSSNLSDILIVSGGGGGGLLVGDTDYSGKEAGGISGSGDNSADQTTGNAFGQGESGTNLSGGGSGLYGGYKGTSSKSGGAGSGYIGNSLVSNKKMVGYNVPTSSAESTKTESVNDVSASAVANKPKSGNGFARIKFLREIDFFGFIEHMDKTTAATRFEYIGANTGYSKLTADYSAHTIDFKDWASFPILTKNKPYMVKTDGTADYQLSETDYTKKADGVTASDVSNTSYSGCGAFAWLPKIYQKQEISGNDRIVKFSFTKKDGFEAVGFKTRENGEIKELEGIWIPMFYGSRQNSKLMSINNNASPMNGITIGEFKTAIENLSPRARFFGGAIKNVINDLLTMFALDADIQGIYGNGYMSSSATPTNNIKNGGAFYCSHLIEAIKIFHSILASQELWQYNPYFGVKDGYYYVSPYYEYDTKVITNVAEHRISGYMKTNKYALIDDYGQIPDSPLVSSGMDSQPYYFISNTGTGSPKYSCAGGNYGTGRRGFLTATFDANYSYTTWDRSASPMILPPVGYKPN